MSARTPPRLAAAAVLAPFLLLPLLLAPQLGIGAALAALALLLAWLSPAYPLGFASAGDVVSVASAVELPSGAVVATLFAWTAAGILFAVARQPERLTFGTLFAAPVVLSLALFVVMAVRLTDSPAQPYGSAKVQLFLAVNVLVLLAGVLVGRRRRDLELCLALTLLVALVGGIGFLIHLVSGAPPVFSGRYALSDNDPISLGRLTGVGILIAVYALLTARAAVRLVALCGLPVLAVAFLASGGHAPVVGVIVGLVIVVGLLMHDGRVGGRWPLALAALIFSAAIVSQLVPSDAIGRATSVFLGGEDGRSSNGRAELWTLAWRSFLEHPWLGLGTGGFAAVAPLDLYPHNLFLEAAAEWGLVGLVPLVGALGVGIMRIAQSVRRRVQGHDGLAAVVAAMFSAALLNAMFSGDIIANSDVWLTLGLGVGVGLDAQERAQERPALVWRQRFTRPLRRTGT